MASQSFAGNDCSRVCVCVTRYDACDGYVGGPVRGLDGGKLRDMSQVSPSGDMQDPWLCEGAVASEAILA